jgi:hypothetical protein
MAKNRDLFTRPATYPFSITKKDWRETWRDQEIEETDWPDTRSRLKNLIYNLDCRRGVFTTKRG